MIIKQRQTFADPFLLKVVYPYLDRTNNRRLFQVSNFWNAEVVEPDKVSEEKRVFENWLETSNGDSWWQRIADTINRWLEPQGLEPVPVAVRSDDEVRRRMSRRR